MEVSTKPSASEIAAAKTAADGITPASPAPLMPSWFSGDGVSRWSIVDPVGDLGDVGHQEVHERRVEQLAGLVVGHPLVERAADALGHAPVDLALDDHRVDQVPAVVHDGVLEDADLGGRRGRSRRSPRASRRRTSPARASRSRGPRAPARRPRRPAACPGPRRRTGWPPWTPRRRRSAAGWRAPTTVPRSMDAPGAAHRHHAVDDLEVVDRGLERLGGDPQRLLLGPPGGEVDRRAAHHGGARGEGADGVRHPAGVAGGDLDVLEAHAELVGDDLREDGLVTLALRGQPGRDLDLARGLDVHVGALVGTDPGALDVAGQADADPASLRPPSPPGRPGTRPSRSAP